MQVRRARPQALRVVLGGYGRAPSSDPKEQLRASEWLRGFRSKDDTWDACIAGERGVGRCVDIDAVVGIDGGGERLLCLVPCGLIDSSAHVLRLSTMRSRLIRCRLVPVVSGFSASCV